MKSSPLGISSFLAGMLFLTACNNSETTKTDESTSSDSTVSTTASTPSNPANTTITTPQNLVVAKHKVKDFATWRTSYDAHDSLRLANGMHTYVIGRGLDDSNMVMVVIKTDDMDKAKTFAKSPSLKQAMQKGGVISAPSIQFVVMTFQDTATISSDLRSVTMFNVKDWAAWEKGFKEGEQERLDNGITVRGYGHDANNNNKVRLVTALVDTAKARAYWKSDMLKKRRAAGGVIGEPERFVYRVVQRY